MTQQQTTKSDRPGATAVTTQPPRPTELPEPASVPLSRGWKFAVFLWGTSLVFLTLYEVLYTVFRYLFR